MIGAYCIRKLFEAKKCTDAARNREVAVGVFKPIGVSVHSMNWHRLDTLYDLQRQYRETRTLEFVCNQLIHSYVFVLGFDVDGGLDHFLFCSDRERNKNLFRVSVEDFAGAMQAVASDDVAQSQREWNGERRDWDVKQL